MRCGRSAGSPRSSWALGLVFRKLWSQADRRVLSVNQMKGSAFWPIFSQTKTTMPRNLPSRPILHKPRKRTFESHSSARRQLMLGGRQERMYSQVLITRRRACECGYFHSLKDLGKRFRTMSNCLNSEHWKNELLDLEMFKILDEN